MNAISIKITADNAAAIEAALFAVNGKATAHTYSWAGAIIALAERAEQRLADLGIAKAARSGAVYTETSGDQMPNAYKYRRQATVARVERRSGAWYLTGVSRTEIGQQAGRGALTLTVAQDAIVIAKARASYSIAA